MPSVKNLQLLLAVLLPLAALTHPVPGPNDSPSPEDEEPENSGQEQQSSTQEHHKWYNISKNLQTDITKLRDEQFQRDFGEPVKNMSNYSELRIKTSQITASDRCFSSKFAAQRCLRRIYAGLRTYTEYLTYIERQNLTSSCLIKIRQQTTNLLQIIKDEIQDTQIEPNPISALPEGSAWNQKIVTHSVLYNFNEFLISTTRAIAHITGKNGAIRKGIKWPLGKQLYK